MMEFVDIIGWIGTAVMFSGSIMNIYKHKLCWPLYIIGGIGIIYQSMMVGSWNLVILQLMYMPLNIMGWIHWGKNDS